MSSKVVLGLIDSHASLLEIVKTHDSLTYHDSSQKDATPFEIGENFLRGWPLEKLFSGKIYV